jgi:hypothetical protein
MISIEKAPLPSPFVIPPLCHKYTIPKKSVEYFLEFPDFQTMCFRNTFIIFPFSGFERDHHRPFVPMLSCPLPEFPFVHCKESWTILKFAPPQIQNSPYGLKQLVLRPFRFTKNG